MFALLSSCWNFKSHKIRGFTLNTIMDEPLMRNFFLYDFVNIFLWFVFTMFLYYHYFLCHWFPCLDWSKHHLASWSTLWMELLCYDTIVDWNSWPEIGCWTWTFWKIKDYCGKLLVLKTPSFKIYMKIKF